MDTNYPGVTGGTFATTPLGVILHGSRSGIPNRPTLTEYLGTCSFAVSNSAGLGWTATVGDDRIALHYPYTRWGWSAREASSQYLAVELAQATVGQPISDGQVRAFCWFFEQARKVWPRLPKVFPTHAELPSGKRDGKSDVFPLGDQRADELRARIMARLAAS